MGQSKPCARIIKQPPCALILTALVMEFITSVRGFFHFHPWVQFLFQNIKLKKLKLVKTIQCTSIFQEIQTKEVQTLRTHSSTKKNKGKKFPSKLCIALHCSVQASWINDCEPFLSFFFRLCVPTLFFAWPNFPPGKACNVSPTENGSFSQVVRAEATIA